MIRVENLHKYFGDLKVLKGINEHIQEGEVVAVIGPSGSGKSTFLRCLNLLETPTEGKIFVDDEQINAPKVDVNRIRQKMGMVFQQFNLFPHLTVMENLTLAPVLLKKMTKEQAVEKGKELLKRVGLAEKAESYPNQLSGGQKQRIAIARALEMNPEIMLFDEPTSALDPISTAKIEDLIFKLKKDYTIVIVTHNMQQAARISDETGFFLNGELIEYNNTKDIFTIPSDKRTEDYITGRFG